MTKSLIAYERDGSPRIGNMGGPQLIAAPVLSVCPRPTACNGRSNWHSQVLAIWPQRALKCAQKPRYSSLQHQNKGLRYENDFSRPNPQQSRLLGLGRISNRLQSGPWDRSVHSLNAAYIMGVL